MKNNAALAAYVSYTSPDPADVYIWIDARIEFFWPTFSR
jgi:hypothetical protein